MSRVPNIADTLPETQTAYRNLKREAAARGIDVALADYGAFRTEADTAEILQYRKQDYAVYLKSMRVTGGEPVSIYRWRRIAPYGGSYHDFGAAFDLKIVAAPKMTRSAAWRTLWDIAPSVGLRSGHAFGDDPHFELAIGLQEAADWWKQYTSGTGRYAPSGSSAIPPVLPDVTATASADTAALTNTDAVRPIAATLDNGSTGGATDDGATATGVILACALGTMLAAILRRLFG